MNGIHEEAALKAQLPLFQTLVDAAVNSAGEAKIGPCLEKVSKIARNRDRIARRDVLDSTSYGPNSHAPMSAEPQAVKAM